LQPDDLRHFFALLPLQAAGSIFTTPNDPLDAKNPFLSKRLSFFALIDLALLMILPHLFLKISCAVVNLGS
jgi:hypothetical protein